MADWVEWHRGYDDPASSLSRRLQVVQARIRTSVDALPPGRRRLLSLCAGDGRDVIAVLAEHHRHVDLDCVLVELDSSLAAAAAAAAHAHLPSVEVRQLDAGDTTTYRDMLPADILLLCGVFGNVDTQDVWRTISAVPAMVSAGGCVIWTRGPSRPDLRPEIRARFAAIGLDELAYDGEPEQFGVGLNRMPTRPRPLVQIPERLFEFLS